MYKSLNDAFSNMVPDVETITVDVLIRFSFNESDILKNMKIEKEKEYLRFDLFLLCFIAFFITGSFDHYWLTLQKNFLQIGVFFGLITNRRVVF